MTLFIAIWFWVCGCAIVLAMMQESPPADGWFAAVGRAAAAVGWPIVVTFAMIVFPIKEWRAKAKRRP